MVAKLASPHLLLFLLVIFDLAVHVKDGLALGTEDWVASCEFPLIFEALHLDLEDVSVYLFLVLLSTFLFLVVLGKEILRVSNHGWRLKGNLMLLRHHHSMRL